MVEILIVLIFLVIVLAVFLVEKSDRYYKRLPLSLKNEIGDYNFSQKLHKSICESHQVLLDSVKENSKPVSIEKILNGDNTQYYIEKFSFLYFDDFTLEIADKKLDWNNENTKLFFELMLHKYDCSHSAILQSILYLRNEISYFYFFDSMNINPPDDYEHLLEKIVRYLSTNTNSTITTQDMKRAAWAFGFGIRKDIKQDLVKRKQILKLEDFDREFQKSDVALKDSSDERLRKSSWQFMLSLSQQYNTNICEDQYMILPQDFSRDSRIDRFYRNHLKFALIDYFDSKCVGCENYQAEFELDHFWLPKSKGGNFAMRSKKGFYVNNCIPLCRTCNASKGAKAPYDYFTNQHLKELFKRNLSFSSFINEHMEKFRDTNPKL